MSYFEPTSSERRGLAVLAAALLLAVGVALLVDWRGDSNPADGATLRNDHRVVSPRTPRYYAAEERMVETFDFDPNEADSTTLLRLGFAPFQVRGIYKYRAMGGRYHEKADVQRIPGMTNELWDRLAPHVRIAHKYQYVEPQPRSHGQRAKVDIFDELVQNRDTVRYPVKLEEGQQVSLNEADTSALKKIPGIGSYYARQIVRYRDALGGFVSMQQLQEIEDLPEGVEQWLTLDTSAPPRRIDVNHASKQQLVRHPYVRVYRARAIWDHVHNSGPLRSIDELRQLPDFTEADIRRLTPYLEFK